jgi:hypothetical protein
MSITSLESRQFLSKIRMIVHPFPDKSSLTLVGENIEIADDPFKPNSMKSPLLVMLLSISRMRRWWSEVEIRGSFGG